MYKSIHIQNFRCFEDTKIEGFEQINLIGGQNNAGKTALLEALYFAANPRSESIFNNELYNRKKIQSIIDANDTWKDIFFEFDSTKKIRIETNSPQGINSIEIYTSDEVVKEVLVEDIKNNIGKDDLFIGVTNNLFIEFENFKKQKSICSVKFKISKFQFTIDDDDFANNNNDEINKPCFFSSNINFNEKELARDFDNAKLKGFYDKILDFCKVVDSDILDIDTFQNEILIKGKNEIFTPLRLWGDALNKVIGYFLQILDGHYKIFLIDEIENGIHHTNQQKFWTMLFNLAKEFDIQVFATSHSAEMIKAFQEVATEHEIKGGYFTLNRHVKTGKILGLKTRIETLASKLEHQINYRGE
jgi:AAA15 family ATPase/GTPase